MSTRKHTEETKRKISETKRRTSPRGENHKQSVLNEEKVHKIVNLYYALKVPQRQIADMLGVSKGTVTAVVYGWTWSHITGIVGSRNKKVK